MDQSLERKTARNKVQTGFFSADKRGHKMPDQTQHGELLKELVELRSTQNAIKNKLRKVLFNADKGKSCMDSLPAPSWKGNYVWVS